MMFSRQYIIKLYREGQNDPFTTFAVECGHITTLDNHTISADGSILKFGNDIFISVTEQ